MKGYITKIESLGMVDGPGIRTVVFLGGCKLRCKYCENPENWEFRTPNMSEDDLVAKIIRNKPYFKRNNGGVTFSGGEPLLQAEFLINVCKKLKKEGVHIALDTAGVGIKDASELLALVDLVLLDIKHVDQISYFHLTGHPIEQFNLFIEQLNNSKKEVWIRQVIIPGLTDTEDYVKKLALYLKKIANIKRVDFLPYHKLGDIKYEDLKIINPYLYKEAMDKEKSDALYEVFKTYYEESKKL